MRECIWGIVLILFLGVFAVMARTRESEEAMLTSLLPDRILDWIAEDRGTFYDPESIFDYINGAGEVYRSYNFVRLLARRYIRQEHPIIVADIFDMGSSEDAFGVFTHDLEGEELGMGQGSTYKGGLLSFWKGRVFASLYAEEETDESKEALLALGRKVESRIKEAGRLPELISFLPQKGLDKKDVRYFHSHLILNYHFFVSEENVLLLDQQTEAVLAAYGPKDDQTHLLVVKYPGAQKAVEAYNSFIQAYMPDAEQAGVVLTENARWTAVRTAGSCVLVVFDAPSKSDSLDLLGVVQKKMAE